MATLAELEKIVAELGAELREAARARKEADEARRKEAEEARKEVVRARKEAEEARKEVVRVQKEAEEARKEAVRVQKEAEEARRKGVEEARREAVRVQKEAEEARRKEAEEARKKAEEAEKARNEAEDARRKEASEAFERQHKKTEQSIDKLSKTVNYWVGRFGNTTGYITEMIILPGIRKKMDEHGHQFDSVAARREFYRKDGSAFTETDLMLENGKEVMIVEVKTHLTKDDVEYQVKRLNRLRKSDKEARIDGKSLLSAVAGVSVDNDALEMAHTLGMYVIRVKEHDENITVEAPAGGVGRW